MKKPLRHPIRRSAAVALLLCAVLSTVSVSEASGQQDPGVGSTDAAHKQYDEILGQEADLTAQVQDAQVRQVHIQDELQTLDTQSAQANREFVTALVSLDRSRTTSRKAEAALRAARRRVVRAEGERRRQAVESYVSGGAIDTTGALLGTTDADVASRIPAYAGAISLHQSDVISQLRDARHTRDRAARRAARARQAASRERDRISSARALIGTAQRDKTDLANQLNEVILVRSVALDELQGRKAIVLSQIAAMNSVSDSIGLILAGRQRLQPDFQVGGVTLDDPLPGAPLASPFGLRFHPILHIVRLHAGIDLSAPSGTPIHAAADGLVVIAGVRGGYGNATVIDHGHSLTTLYGHQSSILVKPGQLVKRGDVIGLVGATGLATGPHLHFETRVRGQPVDPLQFITLR